MQQCIPITDVYAREILDSRGNPTIEVEVLAGAECVGVASVPSGASTGQFEVTELRDGEQRYRGLGVEKAVDHVNTRIAPELIGMNVLEQEMLDRLLIKLDGTEQKNHLGANAMLGVSLAAARCGAKVLKQPLYTYLGGVDVNQMPVPMMNILNGGKHAENTVDFQEFMIMPVGAPSYQEGLRMGTEIYYALRQLLSRKGYATGVGDEGGFAPDLRDALEALEILMEAIERAGYEPGKDVVLALDVAASELYDKDYKTYVFEGESRVSGKKIVRSTEEMIGYLGELTSAYPVFSVEDPLDQEDWEGWARLTAQLGEQLQLVGDDLFVTNTKRLKLGIQKKTANAILIKANQIGTLTETVEAIRLAKEEGFRSIISHRSGETADSFIADFAVAFGMGQIKAGAPCRSERVEKYNQLLRIEEKLGELAKYENPFL